MLRKDAQDAARWIVRSFLGKWYKWGGDDPSGFDCSGLCVEMLKSVGLLGRKEDLTAAGLRARFKDCDVPTASEGCLVFFATGPDPKQITHVEIAVNYELCIGASGGGSKTLTVEDAVRHNAFVKVRPIDRGAPVVAVVNPFLRLSE
jgi:cell wall-associated NlpC family hydrolase